MSKITTIISNAKAKNDALGRKKAPIWVWFLALVPVLSSVFFLVLLADLIPFIKVEVFYTNADGELAWYTSGVLMLMLTMLAWGACGFLYGYFRAKMSAAVLTAHAFPFIGAVVYTVCVIGAYFVMDGNPALSQQFTNTALYASISVGMFSYIDSFIYGFFSLGNFGLYLDLVFMVFTFVAGYTIGKSKRLKA